VKSFAFLKTVLYIGCLLVGAFSALAVIGVFADGHAFDDLTITIVAAVVAVIIAVTLICIGYFGLRHLYGDDGDGLPATNTQKETIVTYFQELNEFYDPPLDMTRGDSRRILKDLEARLAARNSQ